MFSKGILWILTYTVDGSRADNNNLQNIVTSIYCMQYT